MLLTQNALAVAFRLDRRTVARRLDRAGVQPVERRGNQARFDLHDAALALLEDELADRLAVAAEDANAITLAEARRRRAVAEAKLAELNAAQREGELIPGDAGEKIVVDLATATRQRLLAVPPKTALEHAAGGDSPAVHKDISERAIREALEELSAAGDEAQRRLEADE